MNTRTPIFALIALLCLQACSDKNFIQINGFAQGGTYTVKCRMTDRSGVTAESIGKGIDSILSVVDRSVSGYNPVSLLSRYNSTGEVRDDGSPEFSVFSFLTSYCDSLYEATGGVLDTRAAALFDIWGFGFREGSLPDKDEIAAAMKDRSRMNFNAVAQGYSADLIGAYLHSKGIEDILVNIGGEIYCSGSNPRSEGWTLGIDTPEDGNMTPGMKLSGRFTVTPGKSCGVVTSGNYRKFHIIDGVKYSHTIDPRTGCPVDHSLLSATIIAPTSVLADAIATVCMVLGTEKASELIRGRSDLEGCLISADGIWCSDGFTLNQ